MKDNFSVKRIKHQSEYAEWLLKKHYAHRVPSISYAYGLYESGTLRGVCTFGSPPSPSLCVGLAGEKWKDCVIELNRLCVDSEEKNITSWFVAQCFKTIIKPSFIVSYADTSQGHIGKIYQALNFLYTGMSAKRTEWREVGKNTHSKSICDKHSLEHRKNSDDFYVDERPQKHRYIMIVARKDFKKKMLNDINYPILPYPKGETKRYDASYKPISQMVMF